MSLKRGNQSFSLKCVCLSFVVLGRVVECCQKWGGGDGVLLNPVSGGDVQG